MKSILLFLKGILIGIGNMIAGISGGTVAFILGVYEKMVDAFASLTKKFWPNFLYLLKVGLGIIVGIFLASKLLKFLFAVIFIETISLFAGVIIGGIINDVPDLKLLKEEKEHHKEKYPIVFGVAFLVVIGLAVLNLVVNDQGADINATFEVLKFKDMVILFFLTMLGTLAMIFPGISGSLIFMIVGLYYPVLNGISALIHFENYKDSAFLVNELKLFIPLILGAAVSLVFLSKPIKWLFHKYHKVCLYMIMGFVCASVAAVFIVNVHEIVNAYTWWHVLLAVLFLAFGIFLSMFLKWLSNRKKKEEEIETKENTNPVE
ncbi:MAG: DUF368 domain-containing protein [Gammaproteobacteria bacterium]|nr:DUF368 domain-containing protein [Gammaproteobacteria bacterium]